MTIEVCMLIPKNANDPTEAVANEILDDCDMATELFRKEFKYDNTMGTDNV
jgi:hypothetical protein